jgi:predicted ATPase
VRRDTELVGRAKELAALRAAWLRARDGRGGAVLLEGDAGLGKTRLVDRFLQSIDGAATHALYGSFPPGGGLAGLADAILGKFGRAGLADALAPYVGGAAALLPGFVALVRHEAVPAGEALDSNAVQALCCRLLRELAAERPTLWVMDDLHFAPGLARDVAVALARAATDQRALLVLTSRPLPDAERALFPGAERVTLGRLDDGEVAALLEQALGEGSAPTPAFVRKAGGVPMFALELARAAGDETELPAAIVDMISARLRDVGKDERAVLDVGAVQGYSFDPDLAAKVLERPAVTVLQDLADLERRQQLVRAE